MAETGTGEITASVYFEAAGTRAGGAVGPHSVRRLDSAVERPLKKPRGRERITLQPIETSDTVRSPGSRHPCVPQGV